MPTMKLFSISTTVALGLGVLAVATAAPAQGPLIDRAVGNPRPEGTTHRGKPKASEAQLERDERRKEARDHAEERRMEAENARNLRAGTESEPSVLRDPPPPDDGTLDGERQRQLREHHRRRGAELDRQQEELRLRRLEREKEMRRMAEPQPATPPTPSEAPGGEPATR